MMITKAKYVASAVNRKDFPPPLPEVAFIGRSNVGKSSLINSLTGKKNLARTSGTPGKTQTINFFEALLKVTTDETACYMPLHLVDLPGYGYAKVSKDSRRRWQKFIEDYLTGTQNLLFVALLVDARHDPMKIDGEFLDFLTKHNLPVLVIATKCDKVSKSALQKSLKKFRLAFSLPEDAILPYSSYGGMGKEDLLTVIKEGLEKADGKRVGQEEEQGEA